jgi:AbrB family transcriptional regulator (stage V sporulation protein T)
MKATGIVRRIDDLGRVVIPKELRRALRLREGDPLEMFLNREGGIILKKYSPIGELGDFAREYAESLNETLGHIALITDRDKIIAVTGVNKKEFLNKPIGKAVEEVINNRKTLNYNNAMDLEDRHILQIDGKEYEIQDEMIAPIICQGDVLGTVILATKEIGITFGDLERKLAETAAGFLAKQMEE